MYIVDNINQGQQAVYFKIIILEAYLGLGDLLGGGTFTESVVETTVDILQVLCTASKKCYEARDAYYACRESGNEDCEELLKLYEQACPKAWVSYFDKKQVYDAFKEKLKTNNAIYTDEKK